MQVPFSPGEPLLYGLIMGNPAFNIVLDLPQPGEAPPAQPQVQIPATTWNFRLRIKKSRAALVILYS